MKYKDDVIAIVIGVLIFSLLGVVFYFGLDFLSHIARRVDYPVWKVGVLYFTSVFVIVTGSILGNK